MARPTRSSAAGRKDGDDDKDIAVAAGTKPKRGRPARQPAPGIEQTETPAESSSTGIDSVEAPTVKRRRVATRSSSPAPILKKASDSGAGTHSVGSDNIDDDDDDDEPVENLKRTRALATSKSEKSLSKTIASNSKAASKGARTTAATGNAVSMASRTKRRGSLTSGVDEARPKPAASAKQKNNDLEQQNIDDSDEDNLTLDELKKSRMVMDISSNSDDAIVVAAENEDSTTSGRRSSRRRSSMPSAGANSSSEKNVAPTATEISLDTKVTSEHDRPPTTNTSVDEKTTNGTKPKIIIAKESTIPLENVGRNVPAAASAAPAKVKSVLSVKNSSKSTDSGVDTSGDDNAVLQPTTLTSTEEKDSSKAEATKDSGVAFAMLQLASTAPPLLPEDELLATVDENSTKKSSGDPVIDAGVDDMNSNDVPTAQHGEAPTTVIQEQSKEEPVETSESDDVVTVEDSILGLLALAAVDQATPIVTQCDNAMVNADSPRKDTDYVARIEPLAQSNVQTTAMVTSQLDLPATMGAATITKTQEESQKFLQHTSAAIATLAPVATDTANIKLRSEDRLETSPDVPKIADPALNANLSVSTHDNATENAPVERHAELKQGEARTAPKPVALVSTHPVATETVTPVPLSESTFPLQPATKSESPETGSIADPSPNTTSRNKVVNLDSSKEIDVGSSEPKPTTKVATPVTRMPYPAPKNATTANTFPAFHTGMLNFSPEDEPERQYAALQSIELQDQTKSPVLPVSSNIAAKPANAPTPPTQQDVSPHNVSQLKRAGIFPVGLVTSHDTCNDLVSTAGNNSGEGTANQTHKSDLVEQATRSATDKDISMVKPLGTMNTLGDAQAMNDEPPTASIYQMSALSDAGALISPNTRRTDAPPSNQSNMYMETHAASDIKEREAKQLLDVGTITDVGRLIQQQENEHVKPVLESLKEPERSSLQDVQGKNESVVTLPTPQPIALVKVTDTGEETRKVSALSTDTTQGREDTSFSKADSTPIDESAKTVFSDSMTCLAQGSVNADEVVSIAAKSDRSVERFERDQEKVCSDTEEDEMQVELSSAAATKQSDENADLEQGSAPVRQDPLTKLKSIDGVHRRKRSDDDVSLPSKRRRGAFKPPEKEKVVQQSRLNLERIKLLIFAVGMRVHGPQGYERVFSEYWNALSRRLEGQLSDQERSKSQVTVNSFLRTKSLRSLHNKLILGLLERCIEPTAPLSDLSVNLPRHLRGKIYVASKPLESQISPLEVEAEDCFSKAKPSTDLGLNRDLPYAPAILHMNDINKDRKPVPDATSLRIPGAIIADPHIRRCVDAAGMKASENAIWLLVVAVKEFTKHILENTLSAVKAVKAGHVPPRITTHPMSLAGKRHSPDFAKPNQDATIAALAKIITLNDLHAVTSNLPTSEQSLIGCVSRSTFEYGLFSSCDNDLSIGGRAFDDLKAYIVSSITPPEPKRMKVQAPHQKTQTASLTTSVRTVPDEPFMGRKSPPVRGLGRGAKDLAALKARAGTGATTPNSEIVSAEAAPNEDLSAAIKVETVHPMTVDRNALKSLGKQGRTAAKTSSTTAELPVDNAEGETVRQPVPDDKPKDKPKLSESTSEAMSDLSTHSAAQRRGKGHGVKSLAAMRARSTTSLYDGSDFPDGISTIGEAESEATQQRPSGEPPVAKSESLPAKSCDVSYATDILTESSKVTEKKSSMTAAASKTSEIILDQVALVEEATSGEATVLCNPEDFPSNQEADVRVALSAIEAKESQIERVEDLTAPQQTEPVGVDSDSAVALEESKQTLTTASLTSSANINDKGTVTAVTSMAKPMVTSFDIVSSLSKISQEEPSKDNDVTTENVADKSLPDDSIKCQAETEETKRTTSMLQSDQQSETKSSVGTETTTAPIETTEVVVAATPPLTEESAATTTTEVTAVSTAAVAESTKTTESTTIESSTIIPTPSTSGIVADELIPTTTTTIYQSEEEL